MEVKLLLVYNIKARREAEYYRYVMGEFLPTLQNMGLYMTEGWHTAYGDYPVRLIAFQADNRIEMEKILSRQKAGGGFFIPRFFSGERFNPSLLHLFSRSY